MLGFHPNTKNKQKGKTKCHNTLFPSPDGRGSRRTRRMSVTDAGEGQLKVDWAYQPNKLRFRNKFGMTKKQQTKTKNKLSP